MGANLFQEEIRKGRVGGKRADGLEGGRQDQRVITPHEVQQQRDCPCGWRRAMTYLSDYHKQAIAFGDTVVCCIVGQAHLRPKGPP
jgi:hypothetical protein